jgi:hypothetical protein
LNFQKYKKICSKAKKRNKRKTPEDLQYRPSARECVKIYIVESRSVDGGAQREDK